MIKISQTKQLRRDLCRSVGHEWKVYSRYYEGFSEGGNICSRCKKRNNVWGMGAPVFVGSITPRVDVPVGTVFYDVISGTMVLNDGNSWRTMS